MNFPAFQSIAVGKFGSLTGKFASTDSSGMCGRCCESSLVDTCGDPPGADPFVFQWPDLSIAIILSAAAAALAGKVGGGALTLSGSPMNNSDGAYSSTFADGGGATDGDGYEVDIELCFNGDDTANDASEVSLFVSSLLVGPYTVINYLHPVVLALHPTLTPNLADGGTGFNPTFSLSGSYTYTTTDGSTLQFNFG